MLRQLQMRTESAHTAVHLPTRDPTTQPSPPTAQLMRLATRQHPTAARKALPAAPMGTEESLEVNLQGLDAKDPAPIDLRDLVLLRRQLGHREATFELLRGKARAAQGR